MTEQRTRFLGFGLTIAVVVGAIGILNVGISPAAAECSATGGGSSPTPTSTTQPSGSGSPTGAQTAPVDQLPVPAQSTASPSGSGSASPSSTDDGPLPNLSTILPGEDESSASPTGSGTGTPQGSPTSGQGQDCPTKVSINYKAASTRTTDPRDRFGGKVKSPNQNCERGRDVILKKVRKSGKAKTVGRTVSQRDGAWKIRGVKPKGRFFATAPARDVGDVSCRKGKSKRFSP
ncbi:MAG TPA: hypothetical protein VE174_03655 [Actinomycetota bacterium]|nr:hypothetical protein [Actinomycetota bacterium]